MKRVGLVRLDKIGDLVSTLPVDQLSGLKGCEVFWAISKGLESVAQCAEPARHATGIPLEPKSGSVALAKWAQEHQLDSVVLFYAPWWAYRALARAKIPVRIGRKSQWSSFLYLNRGLRQSRSLSEKHEAEYNAELIEWAFGGADPQVPTLQLRPPLMREMLEKHALKSKGFYVVHPGMAGSAENWPSDHYLQVIRELMKNSVVVVTGTSGDAAILDPLQKALGSAPQLRWLVDQLDLKALFYVLSQSRAVVVPSTGIAHLSASLGVPTLALYPQNRMESPKRWGPRGPQVHVLSLQMTLPEEVVGKCRALG